MHPMAAFNMQHYSPAAFDFYFVKEMENEMTGFSQYHNATSKRAPKKGEYFIFSITKDGGVCSMAQVPGIHTDVIKARAEAQRLAVVSPEKKFGIAQVQGIAVVQGVTWE